jgi:hypothetical protein
MRRKRLLVSEELFLAWVRGEFDQVRCTVQDGVPAGARIVGVRFDAFPPARLDVLLESDEFPVVAPSEEVPFLYPVYTHEAPYE